MIYQVNRAFLFGILFVFLFFGITTNLANAGYYAMSNIPSTYTYYGSPGDILPMPNGDIWYADTFLWKLIKVNQNGDVLRTIGRAGSSNNESEFGGMITALTSDTQGNIYTLEGYVGCSITKLDSNGGFLARWGTCGNGPQDLSEPKGIKYSPYNNRIYVADSIHSRMVMYSTDGTFLGSWGENGTGDGQFQQPYGFDIDSQGRLYIGDRWSDRVQVFSPTGQFLFKFGQGYLNGVYDVEVLSDGKVAVSSINLNSVDLFTIVNNVGIYDSNIASSGPAEDELSIATYIAIASDNSNNILVSDTGQRAIKIYTQEGTFIKSIQNGGTTEGKLNSPLAATFDDAGNIYILDRTELGARIQKFSITGEYISTLKNGGFGGGTYVIKYHNNLLYASNSCGVDAYDLNGNFVRSVVSDCGSGDGQFNEARVMVFDENNNIYIGDLQNYRIQVFDENDEYLTQWGSIGTGDGQFMGLAGIAIDGDGNIYVSDLNNHNIQKFNSTGTLLMKFGEFGVDPGQLYNPGAIEIVGTDILVSTYHRISRFSSDGTFIEQIGGIGDDSEKLGDSAIISFNPVSSSFVVLDVQNHRVEILSEGAKIYNLNPGSDVYRAADSVSLTKATINPLDPSSSSIDSRMKFGEFMVSDFDVDLTQDRNWLDTYAISIPSSSKTLLVNLNPSDAPGVSAEHSLYILQKDGQAGVHICPLASKLSEINLTCSQGYDLFYGVDSNLSLTNINGYNYWRVTGLTGTGGLGIYSHGTALTLTPDTGISNTDGEVDASYTSNSTFIAGDIITITWDSGITLSDCDIPTTDADGADGNDGTSSIVGQTYTYTFNANSTRTIHLCMKISGNGGNYAATMNDDNASYGSALYYIQPNGNEVNVIANIAPTLSLNIRNLEDTADSNICDFGTVSTSDVIPNYDDVDDGASECGYSLAIGTNATNGFIVMAQADGDLRSATASIRHSDPYDTFLPGVEKYGYVNITAAGTGRDPATGLYNQFISKDNWWNINNNSSYVPNASEQMLSYTDGIGYMEGGGSSDVTKIMHGLTVGAGTPAGAYSQVVTYTVTASF